MGFRGEGSVVRVVITGGNGFIGGMLAKRLLQRGALTGPSGHAERIDSLVLLDRARPDQGASGSAVDLVVGDIADDGFVRSVVDRDDVAIFHLASLVSAGCEADFDEALRVNVGGSRAVLEACRARSSTPRVVFASTMAAFGGGAVSDVVSDDTKLTPETTYGVTKAICELLVNEYTRRGFIDGRSARLPTVVIRPGRPNAAASSWVSGVFREPLAGQECVVPVDPDTRVPLCGYRTAIDNLVRLHEVDAGSLTNDRAYNLPALMPSAAEMIATLKSVSHRALGPIRVEPDPAIVAIYRVWAERSSFGRASALGLEGDKNLEGIIETYLADYGTGSG